MLRKSDLVCLGGGVVRDPKVMELAAALLILRMKSDILGSVYL
jgi:hypothetical protein